MSNIWAKVRWATAWLDTHGIFGKVNAVYTDDDILSIWHDNHDTDPVMKNYASIGEWERDTMGYMDRVEIPVV